MEARQERSNDRLGRIVGRWFAQVIVTPRNTPAPPKFFLTTLVRNAQTSVKWRVRRNARWVLGGHGLVDAVLSW